MSTSTQLMAAVNGLLFIINTIVHLGGVVVAVILVIRRATLSRWLILAGIAVPALATICNGISTFALPAGVGQLGAYDPETYVALMTGVNGVCGITSTLGYVVLLMGIWLLAKESHSDEVHENE
jgi:hypothetical protein